MADAAVSDDDIPLLELFHDSDSDTTSSEDSSTDSDNEYEPKPVRICCLLLIMKSNLFWWPCQDALDQVDEYLSEVETKEEERGVSFLNRRVRKQFEGHGCFEGIVTSVDIADDGSGAELFFVKYEDGDAEELWRDELIKILLDRLPDAEETRLVREIRRKINANKKTVCFLLNMLCNFDSLHNIYGHISHLHRPRVKKWFLFPTAISFFSC